MSDVLLRFLSNGLLNVGGDDAKLERLKETASDLSDALKNSPRKAVSYALVAFDPQVAIDDPVILEALDALRNRWATYVNTFSSTPVAVVRAILLEALMRASADDDRIGLAFVASARNVLPHMEADSERTIWADLITEVEMRIDARAEAEWATPSSIKVSAPELELPALRAPKVTPGRTNRPALLGKTRGAAGPNYQDPENGSTATGGNGYWPHNNPQPWATEFGNRMAEAIADAVDGAIAATKVDQADLAAPFKAVVANISGFVNDALQAVNNATLGLQRRTNLLWWKEALFSPSARVGYRDLPPAVASTLMAFDLFQQVPTFSPASVAAFLFEAVESLPALEKGRAFRIEQLVAEVQAHPGLASLRSEIASLFSAPQGRGPVLALIAHPENPVSRNVDEFGRLVGISRETELTLSGWAAWVLRELQAAKAVSEESDEK